MRQFRVFGGIEGYYCWMKTVVSVNKFQGDATAKYRLKVIKHYEQFGMESTLDAFPVGRATVFRWRKRLKDGQGKLTMLLPESTKPKMVRRMQIESQVLEEISRLREQHWRISKYKLKPLLDEFCEEKELQKVSISWIGKVIKRYNLFYQKQGRIYHCPRNTVWHTREKLRVKRAPKPTKGGYIEADTVETIVAGTRRYTISFIDVKLKVVYSQTYTSKHAKNTLSCFLEFEKLLPVPIQTLQTDNGSEFAGEFGVFLQNHRASITRVFTYPNCPKINGVVERYNRTLQEEWMNRYQYLFLEENLGNQQLQQYLYFYNHQRVHQALQYQTPMQVAQKAKSLICA